MPDPPTPEDARPPADLAQLLRDERARRAYAERELAARTDELRRTRTELRAARAAPRRMPAWRTWLRGRRATPAPPVATPPRDERSASGETRRPALPLVRVAALAEAPELAPLLSEFDAHSISASGDALGDADLVIVDAATLRSAERSVVDALEAWCGLPGRAPLVVWHGTVGQTEVEPDRRFVVEHADKIVDDEWSSPGFAIEADNPIGRPRRGRITWRDADGLAVAERAGWPVVVVAPRITAGAVAGLAALMGRGAVIVSESPSNRIPAAIIVEDGPRHAQALLDDAYTLERLSVASRRHALAHLSARAVATRLLDELDVPHPPARRGVAVLAMSYRSEDLVRTLGALDEQRHRDLEIVVGLHGLELTDAIRAAVDRLEERHPVHVMSVDRDEVLGEGLDRAAALSTAPYLAKIDDDDHYGPHHLLDAVLALEYSGADLVGKASQHVYLESEDVTLRVGDAEEQYIDYVPGATFVLRRDLWERVRFPHRPQRVDSVFLRGMRRAGGTIYAGHVFDYVLVRRRDAHTWGADPGYFAARGTKLWDGFHPERSWSAGTDELSEAGEQH